VGVAEDVKQASLEAEETEAVYVPSHQWHWADRVRWMVVRAEGDPLALVPFIQRAIWTVDADQPVVRAQSMTTIVAHSEARRRFVLVVMSAFGLTAMILAVIGLYGVVAGMVVERLPEMGVRAALGASYESIGVGGPAGDGAHRGGRLPRAGGFGRGERAARDIPLRRVAGGPAHLRGRDRGPGGGIGLRVRGSGEARGPSGPGRDAQG
jgi:hypothetical protein